MSARRIAIFCLEVLLPGVEYTPFSFGPRRVLAALRADPDLSAEVRLVESSSQDLAFWIERVEELRPDILGLSMYVWSFPLFMRLAAEVRRRLPGCRIILGGPSARAIMFEIPLWAPYADVVDALVINEGEWSFQEIAKLPSLDPSSLAGVPGLDVRGPSGFAKTADRPANLRLDDLPSPVVMGLVPGGRTVAFETYRGCPMGCQFCQWGKMDAPDKVFSEDYVARELAALAAIDAPNAQLVDAGLNLNSRAFRNLANAEARVGYLKHHRLFASVYPTHLHDQHLRFLSDIKRPLVDLGIQSFNAASLAEVNRSFKESRFTRIVSQLAEIAELDAELILGLPGDGPREFRASVERALELPCRVRVYHCIVLPDALMDRWSSRRDLDFDPDSLKILSAPGWTPEAIEGERRHLDDLARTLGAESSNGTWTFPKERRMGAENASREAHRDELPAATRRELGQTIAEQSPLALVDAWVESAALLIKVRAPEGELLLEVRRAIEGGRYYRRVAEFGVSYRRGAGGEAPPASLVSRIDGLSARLIVPARGALPARRTLDVIP